MAFYRKGLYEKKICGIKLVLVLQWIQYIGSCYVPFVCIGSEIWSSIEFQINSRIIKYLLCIVKFHFWGHGHRSRNLLFYPRFEYSIEYSNLPKIIPKIRFFLLLLVFHRYPLHARMVVMSET